MPKKLEFRLFPLDYENDPEEERFRLSTLDYLTACSYNNYALFFELNDEDKKRTAAVLKAGLERTLSQCRHLVGTIEKNEDGDHSFVKKRDSTVGFIVQWLDSDEDTFPSFSGIEKSHFTSSSLGDIRILSVYPMANWEGPESSPNSSPAVSAFQANFIPGGLIFNMHHHHYANDVMGWASFTRQLAENCYSLINNTPAPSWDPACLDHTRFISKIILEEDKVDSPSPPDRHDGHLQQSSLFIHLPKSKAKQLKTLATPDDGSWISSYDAFSALIWRVLTKHRANLYKPDLEVPILWGEAVNMRRRLEPRVPERIQGNVYFAALSNTHSTQLTAAEIISEAPLSRLAAYIRMLTNSVTQEGLEKTLEMIAPIRDKTSLFIRVSSFPPMSIITTDWRETCICDADFGFGKPKAFRHLFDTVIEGLTVVYPHRRTPDPNEGCEVMITVEKELIKQVVEDPELKMYFEFRGIDVEQSGLQLSETGRGIS